MRHIVIALTTLGRHYSEFPDSQIARGFLVFGQVYLEVIYYVCSRRVEIYKRK